MAGPQYIDFFIDPDTGEIEVKIEGFPETFASANSFESSS